MSRWSDYYSVVSRSQTTPSHIIGQLDKLLREVKTNLEMKVYWDYWDWLICSSCASNQVSTLDGVLEVRNEHFWTVGFGSLVRFSARKLCVVHFSKTLDTLNDHSEPPLSKRDVWNELQPETLWRVRLILQRPVWLTIDCRSNQFSVEWLEKELFFTVSPVSLICWNTTWDTTSRWVQSRSSRCFTLRKSISDI